MARTERLELINRIEQLTNSRLLVYVTGEEVLKQKSRVKYCRLLLIIYQGLER